MPEPTLDLLTASPEALHGWASALFRWDAPKYFGSDRGPATLAALRDAIVAQARTAWASEAGQELSEAEVAGIIREVLKANGSSLEADSSDERLLRIWNVCAKAIPLAFARRLADLDAVRREAHIEAFVEGVMERMSIAYAPGGDPLNDLPAVARRIAERRYAPPAPKVPSVRLSDGSVVTRDGMFTIWTRAWSSPDVPPRTCTDWRQVLNQPTDTGEDFEAVKSLAASVRASTENTR